MSSIIQMKKIRGEMFNSRVNISSTNLKNRLNAILVLQGVINAKRGFCLF